ncbi:hypothetical protein KCU93_g4246, partial [Aureobasidium melanogenum]|jgi:hypothetical protein
MVHATYSICHCKTRRTSRGLKRTKFKYTINFSNQPSGFCVRITPIRLTISNHTPCTYFDAVVFSINTCHVIFITVIAINMDPPTREQFMAGVNSTGPDGRPLPAGAAAAARMTAAHAAAQQAAREQDEETFSTASTAIEEVKREENKAKGGKQKSLVRRLFGSVGDKVAAVLKREQEKKDQ